MREFILHWGDLGGQWGVNRSNSLKWLIGWRLIERVPMPGDRRDHFVAETDIWEMVVRIAESRKEREIDPATVVLRRCVAQGSEDPRVNAVALKRLKSMLEFMETADNWYRQMICLPKAKAFALLKMGSRIVNFLSAVKQTRGGKKTGDDAAADT